MNDKPEQDDFFFFNTIECKAHHEDANPMNLERSLHYRREGELDSEKGWSGGVGVCIPGF